MFSLKRTWVFSALVFLFALAALYGQKSEMSKNYYYEASQKALESFVIARGINAAVSFVQDAEISFEPFGVGINVSPGEFLDPLNDIIEQFSWIMLAVSIVLRIQGYMAEIFGGAAFVYGLVLLGGITILFLHLRYFSSEWKLFFLKSYLLYALVIIAMPAIAFCSESIDKTLFAANYAKATENLKEAEDFSIYYSNILKDQEDTGEWQDWFSKQYESIESKVKRWVGTVVELATQFIVMTILFPLFALFLVYKLFIALYKMRLDFEEANVIK